MEDKIKRRYLEDAQIRSIDEENRTVEFVASDNTVDSYGTVLPSDKWDLKRYEKNGIIGYQHQVYGDYGNADPDDVLGHGQAFVEDNKLIVKATFEPADINEKADKIFKKIQFGSIKGVSVGFLPTKPGHWGDKEKGEDPDVYYFEGQELIEVSVVNIPANPNAVKRSIAEERQELEASRSTEENDTAEDPKVDDNPTPEINEREILTKANAAISLAQIN
jgi:HK97 family phage prohead protease